MENGRKVEGVVKRNVVWLWKRLVGRRVDGVVGEERAKARGVRLWCGRWKLVDVMWRGWRVP